MQLGILLDQNFDNKLLNKFPAEIALGVQLAYSVGFLSMGGGEAWGSGCIEKGFDSLESLGYRNWVGYLYR